MACRANARSKRTPASQERAEDRPRERDMFASTEHRQVQKFQRRIASPSPDMTCAASAQYQYSIDSLLILPSRRTCDGRRMRARLGATRTRAARTHV
jgi:hypothetical protein